jgi:hypothetical protein
MSSLAIAISGKPTGYPMVCACFVFPAEASGHSDRQSAKAPTGRRENVSLV